MTHPPSQMPDEMERIVEEISDTVFKHYFDRDKKVALKSLLYEFAAEIKRSAIEP